MSQDPKFELISFDICPYVQRAVITLKQKKVDFKLTFIDLQDPPEWFNKISPLGKVPLLLVRETPSSEPVVLFESAVINEYLDEVTPPSVFPTDPLEKARQRAWVAVGAEILMSFHSIMMPEDPKDVSEAKNDIWDTLDHVEKALPGGKFFSSHGFSLVDAAFAPVFMRMMMIKSLRDDAHWNSIPKTKQWADALMALPSVRDSVIPEFKQRQIEFLKAHDSAIAKEII